jgi:hypothetical protein
MTLLERYEEIVGPKEVQRLRQLASRLGGKRVVHVNSTRSGGGVAEILNWMVPLMQELGLDTRWEVIHGTPDFYRVTKAFHNGLQGLPVALRKCDYDLHTEVNRENAERLALEADVVFIHDPQPILLPVFTPAGRVTRWVWRCHIDASRPHRGVWKHLEGALPSYDATIFSMAAFTRPLGRPMYLIPPSIDPLSEKNCPIDEAERLQTLERLAIDPERPLILQVSRFDRFKDPLGVIAAYRLIKPYHPELQLVLVGGPADDDPHSRRGSAGAGDEVHPDVVDGIDPARGRKGEGPPHADVRRQVRGRRGGPGGDDGGRRGPGGEADLRGDPQDGSRELARRARHFARKHKRDHVPWWRPEYVRAASGTPVAKHGISITDLHYFFEAMGDENNAQAVRLQLPSDAKELVDLG